MRNRSLSLPFVLSLLFLLALLSIALLTPFLPIPDPLHQNLALEYGPPMPGHPLGLGENGVDLLSQLFWGARFSLFVSLFVCTVSASVGICLGTWAGYRGSFADAFVMRLVDVVYAFPGLLLVVALAAVLGPSVENLVLALCLGSWASYARLSRALTLGMKNREHILAAQALGASRLRILRKHLLPNILAPIIVELSYGLGSVIMAESALSFLGLGAPAQTPSWGQLLNSSREVLNSATHLVIAPGLALVGTVLSFNFVGDGLRDFFDPKMRA